MNVKPNSITPKPVPEDQLLDQALRPKTFEEYIGQNRIKENLKVVIGAAKKRKEPIEHLLLHGPSGLGKTTLAYLIAKELGASIKITSGTALEKAGDVGSILTGLNDGDVLFIDEVHRLNKMVEEVIYPAMENFKLDIVIGKGNSAKTLQIDLPRFTLIAATTKISLLSAPFRSRFGANFRLDFYKDEDIEKIIGRSANLLDIKIDKPAIKIVAASSRFTPRVANRLLKRVRDYAQMKDKDYVNETLATESLKLLEIDHKGLEETDRKILLAIAEKFDGGPVGLKSIAAAISEEEGTIEDVYEPYLMQMGFLSRTPKGRIITTGGLKHLGLPTKETLL
ncbi:MAG: Holliday junction DNA helicase RuvB [Candidatus Yanofskybacteria bacterium RIFCSPLOWO2_02_FULL_43_10]|uniref:Holliday junction branch migration complex subunit RuvB n=1 Tax=Candidatus Yanofskybacteria bacterium RIFCSPLOWO2_12_FULL_43_11b TaxID=1802710 RepID=A0A1F8H902_9BACT|nr:MAG: Holliday junction DNA helicase RuvB [Candidatus Yanofskybacteria bacterium RIFCSPHIGHO2_01_FULL_43_32]OGN10816.1 MAG: Holliday junction DNA helicase RuvB [Candidatus Yanofskybacteria bacterium RIFCSPHIGHO2_02_FULL_43_12]OGN18017.1 MAG: Holliday junction DNA helicase RuvB [Candidatus Yanofskybacteria bacterium RIFCSPHIGHO2_12_FULL_43_11]OGN25038.1 MAG: Holliday junction DNA helicase RuvB [Candidatus Yanofskybacteria bacterium RIFCSPLOWO2_01_FULL_43_46]OGN30340.1 MAG: Holliday junction DN